MKIGVRLGLFRILAIGLLLGLLGGCSTIRVTDPARTADEEYLQSVATRLAVDQLSTNVLRDRKVYIVSTYLTASTQPSDEQQFMLGELRSKLLISGVRLVKRWEDAQIIMEVRSQGISNNHLEFLVGLPSSSIGGLFTGGVAAVTPEIAIVKTTKQYGFSSVAYIAYWADSGEVVASSGPFVGRTVRDDFWLFGFGPRTTGNIPPAEPPPIETSSGTPTADEPAAKKPAPPNGMRAKGPSDESTKQ
jgi:hypothetical protein